MEKASLPKKEYALFLALAVVLPVAVATFHCVQMPLWKRQWRIMRRKRKPLQALKTEERKVDPKEFESVPQILGKKGNEGIFIQLGSKDKKKECVGKKQKAEKSYEFDKQDFSTSRGGSSCNHPQRSLEAPPTEYPSYFTLGGRGSGGSSSNDSQSTIAAPQAEDPSPSTEDPSPPAEDPSPPTDDPLPPALGGN